MRSMTYERAWALTAELEHFEGVIKRRSRTKSVTDRKRMTASYNKFLHETKEILAGEKELRNSLQHIKKRTPRDADAGDMLHGVRLMRFALASYMKRRSGIRT